MIKIAIVHDYKFEGTEYWIRKVLSIDGDTEILRTSSGKPYIVNGYEFSVSHTAGTLAIAYGDRIVGIDLQEMRNLKYEKLADRYFIGEEKENVNSAEDFIRIWVRKEAYAKYTGEGLGKTISKLDVKNSEIVFFQDFMIEDMYCSICTEKETEYEVYYFTGE